MIGTDLSGLYSVNATNAFEHGVVTGILISAIAFALIYLLFLRGS